MPYGNGLEGSLNDGINLRVRNTVTRELDNGIVLITADDEENSENVKIKKDNDHANGIRS